MTLICQIMKSYRGSLPQVLVTPGNEKSVQHVLAPMKLIACVVNRMWSLTKQLLHIEKRQLLQIKIKNTQILQVQVLELLNQFFRQSFKWIKIHALQKNTGLTVDLESPKSTLQNGSSIYKGKYGTSRLGNLEN